MAASSRQNFSLPRDISRPSEPWLLKCALADRSTITTKEDCVAVELPKGSTRDALNLVDHPELRGRRVYVKGNIVESYFGTTGLKGTSEYHLN